MTFLTKEYHFGLSRFRDLSLNTIIALEQVKVINDFKGGNAETREEQTRNNSANLGQGPGSTRDIHIFKVYRNLDPHPGRGWNYDFNQPLPQFYAEFSSAQASS